MNPLALLIDAILVLLVVAVTVLGAKRGFVRTVVQVVGMVLAMIIANLCAGTIAEVTYHSMVAPAIEESAATAISQAVGDTSREAAQKIWEELPGVVRLAAEGLGVDKDTLETKLTSAAGQTAEEAPAILSSLIAPVMITVLRSIIFLLLFLVLAMVVRLLAPTVNRLFSFSVVGTLNRCLGGILGLLKGLVYVVLLCIVIGLVVSYTGGIGSVDQSVLDESFVFRSFRTLQLLWV